MSTDVTVAGTASQSLSDQAAEEIRSWMGRRRMSQAELARRLVVSKMWVSYRLSGTQPIDLNDLQRIAAALDVEVLELLPASARRFTREFTDKIAFAATPSIPAPRVASTPVPALAGRFASATLATVQPSGPRRTAPTGR